MFSKSNLFGRDTDGQRSTLNPLASPPAGGVGKSAGVTDSNTGRPAFVSGRATTNFHKPVVRAGSGATDADPDQGNAASDTAPNVVGDEEGEIGARLIVGPEVKLCGAEILNCDMLVVEGRVEATMDSRVLRITEHGSFAGKVSIDVAEIFGDFEGELTARSQLIIHSTGRVRGKICYGKLVAEEGCELCGDISILGAKTGNGTSTSSGSASGTSSPSKNSETSGNALSGKDKTAGKGGASALNAV